MTDFRISACGQGRSADNRFRSNARPRKAARQNGCHGFSRRGSRLRDPVSCLLIIAAAHSGLAIFGRQSLRGRPACDILSETIRTGQETAMNIAAKDLKHDARERAYSMPLEEI